MTWLDTRLATRDDALETMRRASPVWREHEEVLRRVPGLGPGCTRPLWLDLPELGPWRRQRLAALVGVAPWPRDRGTLRGTRTVWGGRTHGRAAWSMRTLVAGRYHPVLTGCSQRLRTAGKAAKVALTACMRQPVNDSEGDHHASGAVASAGGAYRLTSQPPLTIKTVAPLVPRSRCPPRLTLGVRGSTQAIRSASQKGENAPRYLPSGERPMHWSALSPIERPSLSFPWLHSCGVLNAWPNAYETNSWRRARSTHRLRPWLLSKKGHMSCGASRRIGRLPPQMDETRPEAHAVWGHRRCPSAACPRERTRRPTSRPRMVYRGDHPPAAGRHGGGRHHRRTPHP